MKIADTSFKTALLALSNILLNTNFEDCYFSQSISGDRLVEVNGASLDGLTKQQVCTYLIGDH